MYTKELTVAISFPGEGKGYPLQYSGLENSMDCIVGHNWATFTFTSGGIFLFSYFCLDLLSKFSIEWKIIAFAIFHKASSYQWWVVSIF